MGLRRNPPVPAEVREELRRQAQERRVEREKRKIDAAAYATSDRILAVLRGTTIVLPTTRKAVEKLCDTVRKKFIRMAQMGEAISDEMVVRAATDEVTFPSAPNLRRPQGGNYE